MTKSANGQSARVENRLKAQIAAATRHLAYGFDRQDYLLNSSAPDLDMARLKRHCRKCMLLDHKDDFHPMWMKELRVFQPDAVFPRVLREVVGSRYLLELQYIEVACDSITKTTEKADTLLNLLVEHMLLLHSRRPILKDQSVYYWAGRKAGVNLAAYADKPSKIHSPWAGRPAAHMELRIQGAAALARFGVFGVEDLQRFDHLSAWAQATAFAFVPSKTAMGHLLRDGEGVGDDTALRAAAEYMGLCAVDGRPSLHNAVVANRKVRQALKTIQHREIFGEAR